MSGKKYGVRFYSGNFEKDQQTVSQILQKIANHIKEQKVSPQIQESGITYEIRDFQELNDGNVYQGIFATLRDDAPNIREANGAERSIDLRDNEHLIEKNHFLFFKKNELLVWQVNGRGSHVRRFEIYLSRYSNSTITLNDIINVDALDRINKGTVRNLKIRIARPRNAQLIAANDWSDAAFSMMSDLEGGTMSIEVSTRRKGIGLSQKVKALIKSFLDRGETRKLQVILLGEKEPIDLFADCIKENVEVQMTGMYPDSKSMFYELSNAKDRQKAALQAFFGENSHVLE